MKRRRRLTIQADPVPDLVALAQKWYAACTIRDHAAAQVARRRADAILKANPQYMDRPPMQVDRSRRVSKEIFIRWQKFIAYPKKSVEV